MGDGVAGIEALGIVVGKCEGGLGCSGETVALNAPEAVDDVLGVVSQDKAAHVGDVAGAVVEVVPVVEGVGVGVGGEDELAAAGAGGGNVGGEGDLDAVAVGPGNGVGTCAGADAPMDAVGLCFGTDVGSASSDSDGIGVGILNDDGGTVVNHDPCIVTDGEATLCWEARGCPCADEQEGKPFRGMGHLSAGFGN